MRRHLGPPLAAVLADDVRRVDRQAPVRVDDDAEQTRVRLRASKQIFSRSSQSTNESVSKAVSQQCLKKGKRSPYSTTERRIPKLIPVLGSQPAGDVSHKPGGRLPLLSARPAVTLATLKTAATRFAAW